LPDKKQIFSIYINKCILAITFELSALDVQSKTLPLRP